MLYLVYKMCYDVNHVRHELFEKPVSDDEKMTKNIGKPIEKSL